MKRICVAFVLFAMVGMYSCSQHDAESNSNTKRTDSIANEKNKQDLFKAADKLNAPDSSHQDSTKTK